MTHLLGRMEPETGTWQAWYCLEPTFRENDSLSPANLTTTHGFAASLELTEPATADTVYRALQAENWRPGPARIRQLKAAGIHHASMSVGDVVITPGGQLLECAFLGWMHRGSMEPAAAD